ncbi:hypothetical protein C8J57DRAFT_1484320 [Mycena rebaudengoi]|nr:hypothetical protein C8J57DRAFT_1484320 [Mycena rebaudengoi]
MPKPANEVFRLLAQHNHGLPQFTPEPNENLPLECQRMGVRIGDVGTWSDESDSFDPIFNICSPSTSVVNAHGVPPNFEHFPLHPRDTSKRMYHSPGSVITSGKLSCVELKAEASSTVTPFLTVTIGVGIEFKVESKECAILVLPQGASRERLLALQTFRAYVEKYAPQWYTFARDRVSAHGSLFVVTGCDKAASWGIATISTRSSCIGTSLKFAALGAVEGSLTHQYEWQDFGSATVRTSHNLQFPETENQCIFIQGFFIPRKTPRVAISKKILSLFGFGATRERIIDEHRHSEQEVEPERQVGAALARSEVRAGEGKCDDVVD